MSTAFEAMLQPPRSSAGGVNVDCPVHARCGGCPMLTRSLNEQHKIKIARVEQAFQVCGFGSGGALPTLRWARPAMVQSHSEGYRSRMRMRLSEGLLTYFNEAKDAHCLVLSQPLREAITMLREALKPIDGVAGVRHLEVREPDAAQRPAAFFTMEVEAPSLDVAALRGRLPNWHFATDRDSFIPHQRQQLSSDCYAYVPIHAFAQIHKGTNALLIQAVIEGAVQRGLSSFADLFAGAGNFAIPLAARGLEGMAVEQHQGAAAALNVAAREQGLSLRALGIDALEQAATWANQQRAFDLVVLNPPRAGLKHGYDAIAAIAADSIALCCCSATSIARDAAALVERGFRVGAVQCFDMFPHTDHVEVLVWLTR